MILPFVRDGESGSVQVTIERVDDPSAVGQTAEARGFPCCTALVDFPRCGYGALFGWVQLVRSTDGASGGEFFEQDPFSLFADSTPPSPYCFFGVAPTLFDSPARFERKPMAWRAHSFLAWTPMGSGAATAERRVVPLVGFSWGFDIDDAGEIVPRAARALTFQDWDAHEPFLSGHHRGWTFGR
ncbi:hypothetical protein [Embleya sp. NBC_00896]|uniref:hypothetical protein n=1 Tax=Embleya sp. NBC_00896 TaxID=2975961 RepID=UPI00386EDE09|nr:hypothetical protein OG928_06455 [Embleya sp. NBC_00896]